MRGMFVKGICMGAVLVILGIVAITYSIRSAHQVNEIEGWTDQVSNFFQTTWAKIMGNEIEARAGKYDTKITVLLIGGIIFVLAGGYILYREIEITKNGIKKK